MLLYDCIYKEEKRSLKWAWFLNGRSSCSRCITLEERGRASMPVYIILHTDTLPKATEEISQLRLKIAAIHQSFSQILQRFNQTCVFVMRFILRNSCSKKSLFFCCQSVSVCCPSGKHSPPPCVYVFNQWEFTRSSQHIFGTENLHCVQMFLLLTWKSGCIVPETFMNLGFSSWVCCWSLIIWL